MKKKLKYILILSLLLMPLVPGSIHAANVVSVAEDVNIELTSPAMTLVLENGGSYSSMTVTASSIAITISAGGSIQLTSNDRYDLNHDKPMDANSTCGTSSSYVTYSVGVGEADSTITFTPSTTLCDGGTTTSTGSSTGSSGASSGGSGSSSSSSSVQPATGTQAVSKTVSGSGGGSVATSDNKAGVAVPANLASGNISMNITPKASSGYSFPASGYSAIASQVYSFSLTSGGTDMTDFSSPVTLTFTYTSADIAGLDEDSLKIYYRDGSKWILVGGTVDKANQTVTAEVDHFTIFGVFGAKTSDEATGDLIKLECGDNAGVNDPCRSVYYLGSDSKRYVFPNPTTYNSWYADFSDVKIVASDVMAAYPIGGNVTIRPGAYLIKVTTDPKVYAVEAGGVLRWVDSEETAKNLYGDNWAKKIVDVSDTFFINYDASSAVDNKVSDYHPAGTLIKYAGSDDVYYITSGNAKRFFGGTNSLSNNGFRQEFIVETDIVYENGANIVGIESALKTTAGP